MTGMSWWNFAAIILLIWIASDVLPSRYPLLNLTLILGAVFHAPILYVIHLVKELGKLGKWWEIGVRHLYIYFLHSALLS